MDRAAADRWVTISAVIVLGMYGYRRLTEAASSPVTIKKLIGVGNPVPLGAFATAWGFTFLVLSIMAEAAPGLGGGFAILIATSDFLTNSQSVFSDVTKQEGSAAGSTSASTTPNPQTQAATVGSNLVDVPGGGLAPLEPLDPGGAPVGGIIGLTGTGINTPPLGGF